MWRSEELVTFTANASQHDLRKLFAFPIKAKEFIKKLLSPPPHLSFAARCQESITMWNFYQAAAATTKVNYIQ